MAERIVVSSDGEILYSGEGNRKNWMQKLPERQRGKELYFVAHCYTHKPKDNPLLEGAFVETFAARKANKYVPSESNKTLFGRHEVLALEELLTSKKW